MPLLLGLAVLVAASTVAAGEVLVEPGRLVTLGATVALAGFGVGNWVGDATLGVSDGGLGVGAAVGSSTVALGGTAEGVGVAANGASPLQASAPNTRRATGQETRLIRAENFDPD